MHQAQYTTPGRYDHEPPASADELLELLEPPAWHADAACREHPELNFFPTRGEDTSAAQAVCAGCLVRGVCLATASDAGDPFGIWGGLSGRQRRQRHVSRGRSPGKLSKEERAEILELSLAGVDQERLARRYRVNRSTIFRALQRERAS